MNLHRNIALFDSIINELLKEIIANKTYYNDYKTITEKIIYDNISYDKAISVINKIIELNIFQTKKDH